MQKASLKTGGEEDEDEPPVAKPGGKPNDADDFQLQRALAVLRYGSVAAAEQDSPTAVYTKPTPKFVTAQAASKPTLSGAAAQIARTRPAPETAPAGQIAPSAPTPPMRP